MTESSKVFTVGARGSKLSGIQTRDALRRIGELLPGVRFELRPASSPGDRDRRRDLRDTPADFFTRDLDGSVLAGELDFAVHSAKDMAQPTPTGLDWLWLPWREDPRDVLVLPPGRGVADLPNGARFGVSSKRRVDWCATRFPTAEPRSIRGDVEGRIAQLDAGDYDALVTAAAAVIRLGMAGRITEHIPLSELPTPDGQGTLAVTFRADDERLLRLRSLFVHAVTFVGAGAGSAELCTLAGKRALQRCDVCLHDALVDPELLRCLPPAALCIDVGKRGDAPSVKQSTILKLLCEHARKGRRVVRLKGGDPGVFGRLQEETEALDALRLPYRVLPGVSSLTAATTGTGMLLTRRHGPSGFCAMTARREGGRTADVTAAQRAALPIVLFMGVGVADELSQQLVADGFAPDTPAACVFRAGSDEQIVVTGTLADIAERISGSTSDGPGLLIVGEAARTVFRAKRGALQGRRVLLTCSRALMPRAADAVTDFGGVPVQRSLIRMSPLPTPPTQVQRIGDYDWVTLTSPSAVRCLLEMLGQAGMDVRTLPRILASGPGTLRELRRAGLLPHTEPRTDFGGAAILHTAQKAMQPGDRLLRLRSDEAGPALADALSELGARVDDCVFYRNERVPCDALPEFDAAIFASSSAVRAFTALWGASALAGKQVAAIGEPTKRMLTREDVESVIIGAEATVAGAVLALAAACVAQTLEESP
jgi:uroporphyrinogen III methyltransferase / synthase